MNARIGVLALQGDIQAHGAALARLGVESRPVRRARDLDGLHGLVLPGGESTTMWTFLERGDLVPALQRFAGDGNALYGTCAGVILLARQIRNPDRAGLGILDVVVERNGYGRQTESSIHRVPFPGDDTPVEVILIRAPRIVSLGPGVTTLLQLRDDPLWVEQGRVLGTTFHPELGDDLRFHRRFLAHAARAQEEQARGAMPEPPRHDATASAGRPCPTP